MEKVSNVLDEGKDTNKGMPNKSNLETLERMLVLQKRIDDSAGGSEQAQALAYQAQYELRYLQRALKMLQAKNPEATRFRSRLGPGANNIELIANALQDYTGEYEMTEFLKGNVVEMIKEEDGYRKGDGFAKK